jgi:hypothetical protein
MEGIGVMAGGSLTLRKSEIGPSTGSCEGVRCNPDATCVIDRNYIHHNAEGAIFTNSGPYSIVNNIIVENGTGGGGGSLAGGVRVAEPAVPPAILVNNTIAFNMGRTNVPNGVKCWANVDVRNNIVWMNDNQDIGPNCDPWYNIVSDAGWHNVQGNLNLDPLFINQPAGNYRIETISPAVDAGDPSGIPPGPAADFDGETRFFGSGVDCGADEAF